MHNNCILAQRLRRLDLHSVASQLHFGPKYTRYAEQDKDI